MLSNPEHQSDDEIAPFLTSTRCGGARARCAAPGALRGPPRPPGPAPMNRPPWARPAVRSGLPGTAARCFWPVQDGGRPGVAARPPASLDRGAAGRRVAEDWHP